MSITSMRTSLQDLSHTASKHQQEGRKVARDVQDAIQELKREKRGSLVELMKAENRTLKKRDNAAVIRGTARNLMIHEFEKIAHKDKRRNDEPQLAINKLDVQKIRGFTNGYLYSQGKDGLLESLKGPFANPAKSPLKSLQRMYDQKNVEILNQAQLQMNVKLEREAMYRQRRNQ